DLHLPVKPGTDVVLAWAIAAELERRGGIDRAFVERHVGGYEEFMTLARPWTLAAAARECGLREAAIKQFADWFRTISPAAIFVYNHNPLVVHPDQNRMRRGLAREDLFVVGCDVVMTDSLAYADVVLPACSHFEHDDLFAAYGTHWLQRAEPVIRPQGQALP